MWEYPKNSIYLMWNPTRGLSPHIDDCKQGWEEIQLAVAGERVGERLKTREVHQRRVLDHGEESEKPGAWESAHRPPLLYNNDIIII